MRVSRPYLLNKLLISSKKNNNISILAHLKTISCFILKINCIVQSILPANLRLWCRVSNIRNGNILVIETANANWKMRLCYEKSKIIYILRKNILPSLSYIKIKINPDLSNKKYDFFKINNLKIKYKNYLRLSPKSAAYILHVAACSKGRVKNSLERLAAVSRKYQD